MTLAERSAMILRIMLLLAAGLAIAPATAHADCAATCGDICYAPADTAYFRAEVLATEAGYPSRVRLVERLAGTDVGAIGDEVENVYVEEQVAPGDYLFVAVAAYTDGTSGSYVYNVSRRIVNGEIVCAVEDRRVPVDQYAAMAASPDCPAIRSQLQLTSPPCDDTPGGCNAGAGGLGMGALGAMVLAMRRRRRV